MARVGLRRISHANRLHGLLIATAGRGKVIRLWHAATGEQRQVLRGHQDRISCLSFSPDGKSLISGSADKTVKLWDLD